MDPISCYLTLGCILKCCPVHDIGSKWRLSLESWSLDMTCVIILVVNRVSELSWSIMPWTWKHTGVEQHSRFCKQSVFPRFFPNSNSFGVFSRCFIRVLWRVPPTALYIYLPVPSMGSKLREVLTCLTHANPVRRKRPIMLLLLIILCFSCGGQVFKVMTLWVSWMPLDSVCLKSWTTTFGCQQRIGGRDANSVSFFHLFLWVDNKLRKKIVGMFCFLTFDSLYQINWFI